ncbi:MAG: hypothetical protein ACON5A_03325 [Candidatus Comchoanobacterales bacterium]
MPQTDKHDILKCRITGLKLLFPGMVIAKSGDLFPVDAEYEALLKAYEMGGNKAINSILKGLGLHVCNQNIEVQSIELNHTRVKELYKSTPNLYKEITAKEEFSEILNVCSEGIERRSTQLRAFIYLMRRKELSHYVFKTAIATLVLATCLSTVPYIPQLVYHLITKFSIMLFIISGITRAWPSSYDKFHQPFSQFISFKMSNQIYKLAQSTPLDLFPPFDQDFSPVFTPRKVFINEYTKKAHLAMILGCIYDNQVNDKIIITYLTSSKRSLPEEKLKNGMRDARSKIINQTKPHTYLLPLTYLLMPFDVLFYFVFKKPKNTLFSIDVTPEEVVQAGTLKSPKVADQMHPLPSDYGKQTSGNVNQLN